MFSSLSTLIKASIVVAFLALVAPNAHAQINPNQINWPTGGAGCVYAPGSNTCVAPGGGSSPGEYVFAAGVNGAVCDDSTDDTGAFNTLLGVVYAAGGGVVHVYGTCLISGQINLPNDAASTNPKQASIRITGSLPSANGSWISSFDAPSVLDMRFNATYGKILTLALGQLEIDHLMLKDGGSDCAAFVYTTNTTVAIHDVLFSGTAAGTSACNDAVILGGTTSGVYPVTLTPTIQFSGYNTYIRNNFFDKIRRGVYFREAANAVTVKDNTWSATCGATSSEAAIEVGFSGMGQVQSNVFSGNLFEVTNYPYVYKIWGNSASGGNNQVFGDTFWDGTGTLLFLFHFVNSGSVGNSAFIAKDASITEAKVSDSGPPADGNVVMDMNSQGALGLATVQGKLCLDSSGSGTAKSCTTNPSFTPGLGSWIIFKSTTANSGAGLTVNVNSLGAKSVAKWQTTTTLAANDYQAGAFVPMYYDGTNWEMVTIGNAPSGGSSGISGATTGEALIAGSATTATSSEPLAGAGAGLTTGPTSGTTADHVVTENGTNGQVKDSGVLITAIPLANLAVQAADTVAMNASGGSAVPTAVAMPTCTTGADLYNTTSHAWSCVSTGGGGSSDYVNITGSGQVTATGCTQSASTGGKCTISGTSTSSVTFSVIPGTYNNLKLYLTTKTTAGNSGVLIQFNSDTGANYLAQGVNVANTTVTGSESLSSTSAKMCSVPASTGLAASCVMSIPAYANTTFPKVILAQGSDMDSISSGTNNIYTALGGGWNSTAAITSITISGPANFANGTIFSLYGEN